MHRNGSTSIQFMSALLTGILLFFPSAGVLGQSKGASPVSGSRIQDNNSVYAVVIGISDYQSPHIVDLRYADRDARLFVEWLKSPAGGSLDDDRVVLLTNGQATRAEITAALDWLMEMSRKGGRFVIYFSGHGDVETKTKFSRGYLLCHDTPPNNYAAGALPVSHIQDVVSTLSDSGRVWVITDACRAGKLAGSAIHGSQLTSAELARQFSNELKILSCQPDEFSLEGKQWGQGRGVFSYFLLDGLYGLADENTDRIISLRELSRYITDRVGSEVAPVTQTPMFVGNMNEQLAGVKEDVLLAYVHSKQPENYSSLEAVDAKGLEERILAQLDPAQRAMYDRFRDALREGYFFDPPYNNADFFYGNLIQIPQLKPLYAAMARNYAVSLQNEVQQAINALLDDDPFEFNNWQTNPAKYAEYPKYLEKAIQLLGEGHRSYNLLKSQQLYFKAYLLRKQDMHLTDDPKKLDQLHKQIKAFLTEAISLNPEAAYLYFSIADLYWDRTNYQFDSLKHYFNLTVQWAPTWINPYVIYFDNTLNSEVNIGQADSIINIALGLKPDSYHIRLLLSWLRIRQGEFRQSDSICVVLQRERPDLFNALSTRAQIHSDIRHWRKATELADSSLKINPLATNWASMWYHHGLLNMGRYQEANAFYLSKKEEHSFPDEPLYILDQAAFFALNNRMDSARQYAELALADGRLPLFLRALAYQLIGDCYFAKNEFRLAEEYYWKSVQEDPTPDVADLTSRVKIGKVKARTGDLDEAESIIRNAILNEGFFWYGKDEAYCMYGDFLLEQGRIHEAIGSYQKSLSFAPYYNLPFVGLARCYLKKGNKKLALENLEKALENFYLNPDRLLQDPQFKALHRNAGFNKLLEKYDHLNIR